MSGLKLPTFSFSVLRLQMFYLALLVIVCANAAPTNTQRVLDHINMYRTRHQAPPVSFDDTISAFSQSWSDHLASRNLLQHSTGSGYGENFAWFGWQVDGTEAAIRSIDMWYNEIKDYDFSKPGFGYTTGHFTQLVWVNTRKIGLGVSFHSEWGTIVNMNFDPPGNFMGAFNENVKPIGKTIVSSPPPPLPKTSDSSPPPPPKTIDSSPPPPPKTSDSSPPPPLPKMIVSSPPPPLPKMIVSSPPPPLPKMIVSSPPPPPKTTDYPPCQDLNIEYTLSIKYPALNQTHIEEVLCPALTMIFVRRCNIQLVSTTGIYYGMQVALPYNELRMLLQKNLADFTRSARLVCDTTIAVYKARDELFRYKAASEACL